MIQQMFVAGFDNNGRARVVEVTVKVSAKSHVVQSPIPPDANTLLGYKSHFRLHESPLKQSADSAIRLVAGELREEKARLTKQIEAVNAELNKLQDLADTL